VLRLDGESSRGTWQVLCVRMCVHVCVCHDLSRPHMSYDWRVKVGEGRGRRVCVGVCMYVCVCVCMCVCVCVKT